MIKFLIKKFIKNYENTDNIKVREGYSLLSGTLGIICNAFLCILKVLIGLFTKSISIMSDAVNNLSDMGTCVLAIISTKISNKQPDKKHPYGYGRLEYLSSLLLSLVIILVGIEVLKSSITSIVNPEPVSMSIIMIIILAASILVKVWMFFYNRYMGRAIKSQLLLATSTDSLSDCMSTGAVVIGAILTMIWPKVPFDGIIGVLVSILIIWNGLKMVFEVVSLILGGKPDDELIEDLKQRVLEGKGIMGVHDLIVHDYGPGRIFASAHAEVPYDGDFIEVHEIIDDIEMRAKNDLGVVFVIHMDPIVYDNPRVNALRELAEGIVHNYNEKFSIHDFRITEGENRVNLIFDMVVPPDVKRTEREAAEEYVREKLKAENEAYFSVIQVESTY